MGTLGAGWLSGARKPAVVLVLADCKRLAMVSSFLKRRVASFSKKNIDCSYEISDFSDIFLFAASLGERLTVAEPGPPPGGNRQPPTVHHAHAVPCLQAAPAPLPAAVHVQGEAVPEASRARGRDLSGAFHPDAALSRQTAAGEGERP